MQIIDEKLYYVGGYVRDEVLGCSSLDIDYCFEGNAIEFAMNLDVIKTNPELGTVRVLTPNGEIDIASTRTEDYPRAGHLPVLRKLGCSLEEDLGRRDFTINALAKNTLTGELVDFFHGLNDIKDKKIRVLHENSFIDDPSRIIRALKFAIRFDFDLEENTKRLQEAYLANINYDISYHRLKKELKETFELNSQKALEIFINQGLYKLLGPEVKTIEIIASIEELNNLYKPKNVYMTFLGLFDLANFELTKEEKAIVSSYNKIKTIQIDNDVDVYKAFVKVPLESIILYAATINYDVAINYLENLSNIKVETNGEDLLKLGIQQGEIYNVIFQYLLEEKIKTKSLTKEDEIILIKNKFNS